MSRSPVPLFDPARCLTDDPTLHANLKLAFDELLLSGHYVLGPKVRNFEAQIKDVLQIPHALGVSSGTDALLLSLMAANIGPGDAVLCPSFTFFATAGVIARLGAHPVFIDSCPGCFNLLPQALDEALARSQKPVRALIAVHLFGQMAAMPEILSWAKRHQILVIEDAAQALGAQLCEQQAGTFGDFGCFSFFPTKNLGAPGDAGLVVTPHQTHADTLEKLRVHGAKGSYIHESIGGNFRMDALQGALLSVKLPYLKKAVQRRQANARRYEEALIEAGVGIVGACLCTAPLSGPHANVASEAPFILPCHARGLHTFNQYVIRVSHKKRDRAQNYLREQGITTAVYYPLPLHKQPCFRNISQDITHDYASHLAESVLALPIYPELREEEQERVIEALIVSLKKN